MTPVYILTRARHNLLRKALPHWGKHDCDVTIVVGPRELKDTAEAFPDFQVKKVSKDDIGVGAIRQEILLMAKRRGLESFIMADDDLYPAKGNIGSLCDVVIREQVVGCGASNGAHGLFIGNEILKERFQFPIASGFAHRLFALNTELAVSVGGFPRFSKVLGNDDELQRRGIAKGYAWWYDTKTSFTSMAARFAAGGIADLFGTAAKRDAEIKKVHERYFTDWPKYVSDPEKSPYRCYWKKMMRDYIPDWEKRIPRNVKRFMDNQREEALK